MRKKLLSPNDRYCYLTKTLTALMLLLVLLLLLDSCCSYKEKTVTVRDTVLTDVAIDTVRLNAEPILKYDSTLPSLTVKPFSFQIDTIIQTVTKDRIKFDTVKINYAYPKNFLNFSYLPEPDSTFKEVVTNEITKVEQLNFWDYIPIVVTTALVFFVFGYIVAKFR